MICPDCSEDIEDNISYCPYCGYQLKIEDKIDIRDIKIKELEGKIAELKTQPIKGENYFTRLEEANQFNQYTPYNHVRKSSSSEKCGIACVLCFIFMIFFGMFTPFFMYF